MQVAAVPFVWSLFHLPASQAHFYSNFELSSPKPAPVSSAAAAASITASTAAAESVAHAVDVRAVVMQAVKAVHGQDVDASLPLVQAGLDSLGKMRAGRHRGCETLKL